MSVLGETPSVTSPGASEASQPVGMTADGVSPSAPQPKPPSAPQTAEVPQGALVFHCRACLLDWPEPYCDWCGANLSIDRPSHPTFSETVRGAEGDPC